MIQNDSNNKETVILAHPDALIREGIARILEEAGYQVITQVNTEVELKSDVIKEKPDLLLLDWEVCENPAETVQLLIEQLPSLIVIMLIRPESLEGSPELMQAGVRGYLSVDIAPEDFVHSLIALSRGDVVISENMVDSFREDLSTKTETLKEDNLTERETEVLILVGNGATNREIAERLIISEHTVKSHLRTILNKLGLRNRQQIAAYAAKEGLVPDIEIEDDSKADI